MTRKTSALGTNNSTERHMSLSPWPSPFPVIRAPCSAVSGARPACSDHRTPTARLPAEQQPSRKAQRLLPSPALRRLQEQAAPFQEQTAPFQEQTAPFQEQTAPLPGADGAPPGTDGAPSRSRRRPSR